MKDGGNKESRGSGGVWLKLSLRNGKERCFPNYLMVFFSSIPYHQLKF